MPINGDILSECVPPRPAAEMLLIESLYDGDATASDRLELGFDYRTKSRLRATLASGAEAGLFLPRGTLLRGGQKLQASDGRIVAVVAAPEDLLEARCASALELARAAYHLGNRHVAVQVTLSSIRYLRDHVLDDMLRGLGLKVEGDVLPFEPEGGAYSQAHSHGHGHGHDDRHGHGHGHGTHGHTPGHG